MANGSLIIRKPRGKKQDIANEKYATEAQISVRPKKNQKNFIFLLTLSVTYVTIVNVTYVIVVEPSMKKTPRISEAEWEVMKVLWDTSPATANDIVKRLSGKTHWKRETIRTLINRLVQKKAVGFEKKGRQYHYFPLVTEAECIKAEARTFLKRLGGGLIEPMLVAFVEEENLSGEKIARLRRILKKAADENKKAEK
jgi:BlaI family penicillinase repressor